MLENHNFERTLSEEETRKYRLPFALCKDYRIQTQDWWTPRDAWEALINHGIVEDVSDEYEAYYREIRRKTAQSITERKKKHEQIKREQLSLVDHVPDKNYVHRKGYIAGAEKRLPMTFEQANGGKVNPFFDSRYVGYHNNCQACVAVYYARRLGYDVRALPNLNNKAIDDLSHDISLAYRDEYGEHPKKKYITGRFRKTINQTIKEGEIYAIEWRWKKSVFGHVVSVERKNGNICFYDPQDGNFYTWKNSEKLFQGKATDFSLMKLTGCTMDERFADKIMKKVRREK